MDIERMFGIFFMGRAVGMVGYFEPKYYRLDQIPAYRLKYLESKLESLIQALNLKLSNWPLDCFHLLSEGKVFRDLPVQLGFKSLPQAYDAATDYFVEHGVYAITFNKIKYPYPVPGSYHFGRFNFTVAHELAHILLEHVNIPMHAKNRKEQLLEDLESDEFASRFLMPEELLLQCNFASRSRIAKYFLVSEQAIWMRLNHMKRLDLLRPSKWKVCEICGNGDNNPYTQYCKICSADLHQHGKGIMPFHYTDGVQLDKWNRVHSCLVCNSQGFENTQLSCKGCGMNLYNFCMRSTFGACMHFNPGNARYCESCGYETMFLHHNILKPWQEARSILEGSECSAHGSR